MVRRHEDGEMEVNMPHSAICLNLFIAQTAIMSFKDRRQHVASKLKSRENKVITVTEKILLQT